MYQCLDDIKKMADVIFDDETVRELFLTLVGTGFEIGYNKEKSENNSSKQQEDIKDRLMETLFHALEKDPQITKYVSPMRDVYNESKRLGVEKAQEDILLESLMIGE